MASTSPFWSLDEFAKHEPERAAHLAGAPPWPDLVAAVRQALRAAITECSVRFAFGESSRDASHYRGTIQFLVGRQVFDWLFNGHTGNRAQFRQSAGNGLTQNDYLIAQLRAELTPSETDEVLVHLLSSEFILKGSKPGRIGQVINTLRPRLSKVWACEKLIEPGRVQHLFVSRTGPKLTVGESGYWSSLYPEDNDGWLDVKGAFMSPAGPYQVKSPEERAKNLAERGSA